MSFLYRPSSLCGLVAIAAASLASVAHAQKTHQFDGGAMTLPAGAPSFTSGPSDPYPYTVTVFGVNAPIADVKVRLSGFTHTWPIDLNVLLVGPFGQTVLLMNRVGGGGPGVSGVDYLFVDGAATIPLESNIGSGRYAPSQRPVATGFSAPAPAEPYGTTLSVFDGSIANGTWSLYIQDEAGSDSGSLARWSLIITEAPAVANPAPITIPAFGTDGPASVYPSTVIVDGVEGPLESVSVMLLGLNHTYQIDIRILLVGPGGQNCLLLGRCGSSDDYVGHTLIIDDNAPANFPETVIAPGTYRPTACFGTGGTPFDAPAPAPPYGSALSVFDGTSANGAWRLYIDDGGAGDVGALTGGWVLSVNGQGFCAADFDQSGSVAVPDIFAFLSAWFAGCP